MRSILSAAIALALTTPANAGNIHLAGNTVSAKFSVELFACRNNVCDRNILNNSILMYLSPSGAVFDYSNGQTGTVLRQGKWNRIGEGGNTEIRAEFSGSRFSLDSRVADSHGERNLRMTFHFAGDGRCTIQGNGHAPEDGNLRIGVRFQSIDECQLREGHVTR